MGAKVRNKEFLDLVDQELLLIKRNLHIDEADKYYNNATIQKELLDKNYFDLINGFEDLFLEKNLSHKEYKNKSIYDFLEVYNFDVTLGTIILEKIEIFEKKLKARVSYFFSKEKCKTLNDVESYIDINSYTIPTNIHEKKKFKNHNIFATKTTYKAGVSIKKNFIDQNKDKYDYINQHDKLPFWVGIKALNLGEIHWLLYGLPTNVIYNILESFEIPKTKNEKDIFVNSVYIITSLRNACAHFEIITRFNTKSNFKINKNLIKSLNLNPKRNQYIISLYDVLLVLKQFVAIDDVIYYIYNFYDLQYSLNLNYRIDNLLDRMGNKNIDDWLELLD